MITTGEKVYRKRIARGNSYPLSRVSHSVGTLSSLLCIRTKPSLRSSSTNSTWTGTSLEVKEKETNPFTVLEAAIDQQVNLITHWMRVGFIHGVMNNDNMALSGETIIYGPCAFMADSHLILFSVQLISTEGMRMRQPTPHCPSNLLV